MPSGVREGNALLARLPSDPSLWGRSEHLHRALPAGYEESLRSGDMRIEDPSLAQYYQALELVIGGNLFDRRRWREIWNLNFGKYDRLIDAYIEAIDTPDAPMEDSPLSG